MPFASRHQFANYEDPPVTIPPSDRSDRCHDDASAQQGTARRFLTTSTTINTPQNTFLIGADAASGTNATNNLTNIGTTFKGTFDRIRFYSSTLSLANIQTIVTQDTDKDGLWDATESKDAFWKDKNSNNIRDAGEVIYPNSSPILWQPPSTDTDRDGLTDIDEQNIYKTDPYNHDTDGDLLPDGWEVQNGLDPHSGAGDNGSSWDSDGDGLDNFLEWSHLTNPKSPDTDGDLIRDGVEVGQGSNPADSGDNGQPPNPEDKQTLRILLGDPSLSHSERWRIEVTDTATGTVVLRHASRTYGEMSTPEQSTFDKFKPGKAYSFQLIHAGTDPEKLKTDPERVSFPDYDWALEISYKDAAGNFIDVTGGNQKKYLVLDPYDPKIRSIAQNNVNLLVNRANLQYPWEDQEDRTEQYKKQIEPMLVVLLPVEVAPEVLAVNSDFDEGRIDPATGYAIPDCDDTNIALEAVRNHLDGKFAINERVTDDMHPGFFGVNPSNLGNDFWDGANVTIRKIDKTDPATGHPESGHIRLYGKWGDGASEYRAIVPYNFETLATANLATSGINGTSESVYGAASPFPDGTSYFIEGVHPGKITLEWRYRKGSVDFKHEQTFEIYTKKSAPRWRFDLDYKIRLETSNDPSGEVRTIAYPLISDGYEANTERASEFYDFYRECFHEPLRSNLSGYPNALSWPGLARLAGSQVIGGLSDSEWGKRALNSSILVPAIYPILNPLITGWSVNEIEQLQLALFQGGWQIFASAGWQHHAYRSSGYKAIQWVAENTGDLDAPLMLPVWRELHQGLLDNDKTLVDSAAVEITDREQNHTIVPTWTVISGLGLGLVDDMFSILGTNSCSPAGLNFSDLFMVIPPPPVIVSPGHLPFGNLANTADRWTWIRPATSGGILDTWNTQPMARKLSLSGDSLRSDAMRFSIFSKVSTLIPILSLDDEDVP